MLDVISGDISAQHLDERIGQTIVAIFRQLLVHKQNVLAGKIIDSFRTLNERADDR